MVYPSNLRKRARDTIEPTESGSMSPQKRKFSFFQLTRQPSQYYQPKSLLQSGVLVTQYFLNKFGMQTYDMSRS